MTRSGKAPIRLLGSDGARRFAIPAFVVVFANLAALGLLIGWVGASRAYSVGIHTMFNDHMPSVVVAGILALVLAAAMGRRLQSMGEVARFGLGVLVAYVIAGFVPILVFNEIAEHPDLPRILFTETAGGTQLVGITLGVLIGFWSGVIARRRPGRVGWRSSCFSGSATDRKRGARRR